MAEQSTLLIAKPDAVRRGLTGEILRRVEAKGLRITDLRMGPIDRVHRGGALRRTSREAVLRASSWSSSPPARSSSRGWRVSRRSRCCATMMGPTDPASAPPGTIRGDFGTIITENLVHGSDSPESAERELKLFFP